MSEAPPAPEKLLRRHLAVVRQTGEGDVLMAVVTDDEGRSALPYVDTPWIYPADVRGIEDALAPQLRLACLVGFGSTKHPERDGGIVEERLYLCEPLEASGTATAPLAPLQAHANRLSWSDAGAVVPHGLPASLAQPLAATLARLQSSRRDEGNWPAFTLPGAYAEIASAPAADPRAREVASFEADEANGHLDGGANDATNGEPPATLRQVRAWTLSSVWVGKRAVLKMPHPLWRNEPTLTKLLHELAPDVVPAVLVHGEVDVPGARTAAPWMLMRRVAGEELRGDDSPTRLAFVIGDLQRRLRPHETALRRAGVPDRHLASTAADLAMVWASPELTQLDEHERTRIPALDAWIRRKIRAYEDLRPPALLTHGDLHPGNAIRTATDDAGPDARLTIIDWTDAAFAWPGVDLFTIAGFETVLEGDLLDSLVRAYLDGMAGSLGAEAEPLVRLGVELSLVYQIVSYVHIERALPRQVATGVDGAIRFLARRLLKSMDEPA